MNKKRLAVRCFKRDRFQVAKDAVFYSSRHGDKSVMPWFNNLEWKKVFELIKELRSIDSVDNIKYKDLIDTILKYLMQWKARIAFLNAGLDGSIIILQTLSHLSETNSVFVQQSLISNAMVRFLNLICAAKDDKQGTFVQSAKSLGVPEMIINLRHNIAHSQIMPSLTLLQDSICFAFDWLFENYWLPTSQMIENYIIKDKSLQSEQFLNFKQFLQRLFNLYGAMIRYKLIHSNPYVEFFGDIDDDDLRKEIRSLNLVKKNGNKAINDILRSLWNNINHLLNCHDNIPNKKETFVQIVLSNGDFLMFNDNADLNRQHFDNAFVNLWKPFIENLYEEKLLNDVIVKCLELTNDEQEMDSRRIPCALWLCEITSSLKFSLNLRLEVSNAFEHGKFQLWSSSIEPKPNAVPTLQFNLFSEMLLPNIFKDWDLFNKLVFINANEFTVLFLDNILDVFYKPKIDENMKIRLKRLVNNYIQDDDFFDFDDKILETDLETNDVSMEDSLTANVENSHPQTGEINFKWQIIDELSNNQECTKTLMKNRQKCDCDETIESEFNLKYLGSTIVTSQSGELVTTEAIKNILRLSRKKKWNNMQALVPVLLKVSIEGLSVFDPVTNCVKFHNSIYDISYCSADRSNGHIFTFIATNSDTSMELHAFLCNTRKQTKAVTLTVAAAFKNAYDEWRNHTQSRTYRTPKSQRTDTDNDLLLHI